jgi:cbb3-type cytochrome oxidase subunit 3
MSTIFIIVLVVFAIFIIAVVAEKYDALQKMHRAHEENLLRNGPDEKWLNQPPSVALNSLGYVAYLVWFLHCERKYRDYQGSVENQYPPDWEWRRRFVLLRDSSRCQGCGVCEQRRMPLDCHHLKPISQFASGELGIHALTNLVILCPACHASQHPGNIQLEERARRICSQKFDHLLWEKRIRAAERFTTRSTKQPIRPVQDLEVSASLQTSMEERRWPKLSPEEKKRVLEGVRQYQQAQEHQSPSLAPSADGATDVCAREINTGSEEIVTEEMREAVSKEHEEWVKRTGREFVREGGLKGTIFLRERGQDPLVTAFNEALKEERRQKVN